MDRADVPAVGTTIMCETKLGAGTKGDSAPCPVPQEVERIERFRESAVGLRVTCSR